MHTYPRKRIVQPYPEIRRGPRLPLCAAPLTAGGIPAGSTGVAKSFRTLYNLGCRHGGTLSAGNRKTHRENPLLSLGLNIVIPVIVLMRFSGEGQLGPVYGLIVALAFPVGYGLYDFAVRRRFNLYSMLGFVSVLLTGGIGLLRLPVEWLAVKEAAIPFIIGAAVVISMRTRYPIVKTILHKVIDVDAVYDALKRRESVDAYERRVDVATYVVAFGLLVSTILNYVLARVVVVSDPGTTAFNEELGRMTALSLPVITVPSITILGVALYYLVSGIRKETGLEFSEIFKTERGDE